MDELNEPLKLLISVLAPLLLVLPIAVYLYISRHKDRQDWSFFKYCRTFDANHGLGSQPWFSMAIVYPVGLFFSTGIWAWRGLELDISANGFNQFIELSKLPLGLLALSIPLAVLTARLHGTKQTALQIEKSNIQISKTNRQIANTEEQIKETLHKNRTDLYLAHYKHFSEHILEVEKTLSAQPPTPRFRKRDVLITINTKASYSLIYTDSSLEHGICRAYADMSEMVIGTLLDTLELSLELAQNDDPSKTSVGTHFITINNIIKEVVRELPINQSSRHLFPRKNISVPVNDEKFIFISSFQTQVYVINLIFLILSETYTFQSDDISKYSFKITELTAKLDSFVINNQRLDLIIRSLHLAENQMLSTIYKQRDIPSLLEI